MLLVFCLRFYLFCVLSCFVCFFGFLLGSFLFFWHRDGLLDCVLVLFQHCFCGSTRWMNFNALIDETCCILIERVDRPGESQEATGGEKKIIPRSEQRSYPPFPPSLFSLFLSVLSFLCVTSPRWIRGSFAQRFCLSCPFTPPPPSRTTVVLLCGSAGSPGWCLLLGIWLGDLVA